MAGHEVRDHYFLVQADEAGRQAFHLLTVIHFLHSTFVEVQ